MTSPPAVSGTDINCMFYRIVSILTRSYFFPRTPRAPVYVEENLQWSLCMCLWRGPKKSPNVKGKVLRVSGVRCVSSVTLAVSPKQVT